MKPAWRDRRVRIIVISHKAAKRAIQKMDTLKISENPKLASGFENFSNSGFIGLPVCFGPRGRFRYLDFGFCLVIASPLGTINKF